MPGVAPIHPFTGDTAHPFINRVQVDTADGTGNKIWAPLCAPEDDELATALRYSACIQVGDKA
jgi:hypothetical protein